MNITIPYADKWSPRVSYRFLRDPFKWINHWSQEVGDPFAVRSLNGPVVFTGNPEGIKEIFTADPSFFRTFATDNLKSWLGEGSLLSSYGERHAKDRKLLIPPFHGKRMKSYADIMAHLTRRHLSNIPMENPFSMLELSQAISLEIIVYAVFGFDQEKERDEFIEHVLEFIEALHPSFMFAPFLQSGFWPPWNRFSRLKADKKRLILEHIQETRADASNREDILSLLLQAKYDDGSVMSHDEIIDQLNTLLAAGHETTAITLAWAMYWIHQDQNLLQELKDEILSLGPTPDPQAYTKLKLLDATVKETMRIRPILTEVLRTLTKPFEFLGHQLPEGMSLAAGIALVHMNPDLYPEPHKFNPKRFLERHYSPFEFIPFGGGNRRCIGSAFAEFEMKIVLGILLTEAQWSLESDQLPKTVRRHLTMAPDGGVRLVRNKNTT